MTTRRFSNEDDFNMYRKWFQEALGHVNDLTREYNNNINVKSEKNDESVNTETPDVPADKQKQIMDMVNYYIN